VLCAVLFASTLAFGYQAFRNKPTEDEGKGEQAGPPRLDGRTAESGDVVLEAKGYIIPAHQIQVSPQVGGKIESLYLTEGQRVEKGEILAQLEVVEYETDYKRALARLASARQNWELLRANYPSEVARARHDLDEATADLADARDRLDRAQRLDISGQSKEELIRLRNLSKMADARLRRRQEELEIAKLSSWKVQAAKAEMEAAQAELDKALWRLENCTVLAPVSGTILTKKAEESNLVNPVAFNVSASLCEMADLSDLEVDLSIQERDIANVIVGQKCLIMPEAFQNNKAFRALHPQGYEGEVSRLMPIADRAKGAIPVRVKLTVPRDEEGVYLKPDMGVIVSFKKVT
jgi:multidrug resistance efflux pump